MFIRIALLMSIVWVMSLTRPFLTIFGSSLGPVADSAGGGLF
jgi:predicted tellurium resistance membrane protein TerC